MKMHIFVGQGAQFKGMGKDLFHDFLTLSHKASEVLGYDLADTCLNDPDKKLVSTDVTQPALYTVCMMEWIKEFEAKGEDPGMTAGHSLGEYAALTIANVFDFSTGLKLVKKRGELMAQAEGGAMLAVIGDDQDAVQKIIADWKRVDVANLNTDNQMVVSGAINEIEAIHPVLEKAGFRVVRLQVGGAFHSQLMGAAAKEFRSFLDPFEFTASTIPVIANLTAEPYPEDSDQMKDLLCKQICSPVRWADTIRYARTQGTTEFVEYAPKPILTGMLANIT